MEKKRAFVEQCLHDTNVFVINVPIDENPHRNMSPEEVNALWEQASRDGTMLYLYPDGLPKGFSSSQQFKPNGPAKSWYPNGQLAVDEKYDHGKLIVGTYYDEDGKFLCAMTNGTGQQLVYFMQRTGSHNAIDCSITEYHDSLKDGVETIYSNFARREKIIETHYKNGKQDGLQITWDKGRKIKETNFRNGLANGLEIVWYPSGQTNGIVHYRDGHLEASEKFLPDGTKYHEP
ncbi:MAG TPA: hypothetical protein VKQ08_05735 [Cyclobacteriaceae bacterium]|nr:hypothetical protein [Cyclobacteriaceae bacterium]